MSRSNAKCPFCGWSQTVRADGKFRVHSRYTSGPTITCEGVGESPDDEHLAQRAPIYLAADRARREHGDAVAQLAAARQTIERTEARLPQLAAKRAEAEAALKAFDAKGGAL